MKAKKFTLIELIAVIIILGIIAVTAIPKYYDMQEKAEDATAQGVLAAVQSTIALNWAAYLAQDPNVTAPIQNATDVITAMGNELDADWAGLQWTVPRGTYTITIANGDVVTSYGNYTKVVATLAGPE